LIFLASCGMFFFLLLVCLVGACTCDMLGYCNLQELKENFSFLSLIWKQIFAFWGWFL
jgi:hypothetical protein